jgi:hypothetical protein
MTADYSKINLNYKPQEKRNIRRPQTRSGDDFREEGREQGAKTLYMMKINATL